MKTSHLTTNPWTRSLQLTALGLVGACAVACSDNGVADADAGGAGAENGQGGAASASGGSKSSGGSGNGASSSGGGSNQGSGGADNKAPDPPPGCESTEETIAIPTGLWAIGLGPYGNYQALVIQPQTSPALLLAGPEGGGLNEGVDNASLPGSVLCQGVDCAPYEGFEVSGRTITLSAEVTGSGDPANGFPPGKYVYEVSFLDKFCALADEDNPNFKYNVFGVWKLASAPTGAAVATGAKGTVNTLCRASGSCD